LCGSTRRAGRVPVLQELYEAAGLGFEPRLTDPESVSIHSWLFTAVQEMAFSSQILGTGVSRCSPLFTPVTVKSLSKCWERYSFSSLFSQAKAILMRLGGQGPVLRSWVASICLCSRSSRDVRNEFKLGRSPNRTRIKFRGSSSIPAPLPRAARAIFVSVS
jgi:hypothetical protein